MTELKVKKDRRRRITITDGVEATDLSPVKVKVVSSLSPLEGGNLHAQLVLLQARQEMFLGRLHLTVSELAHQHCQIVGVNVGDLWSCQSALLVHLVESEDDQYK